MNKVVKILVLICIIGLIVGCTFQNKDNNKANNGVD